MKTKEYMEAEKKVREILPNWVELSELLDRPITNNRYMAWCILEEMCIKKLMPDQPQTMVE